MPNENRQDQRIVRPLNMKFCISQEDPPAWDPTSVVVNISIGGMKFMAHRDLKDKTLILEINSPRLKPRVLKLEALVIDSIPSKHVSFFDVHVQFINLSETDTHNLSILKSRYR